MPKMKLLWFLLTTLYAIIHHKHIMATSFEGDSLTDIQASLLLDEFSLRMLIPFKKLNTPSYSLEDDDLPLEQHFVYNNGDESLDENLILYNVVIDGLYEIKDDNIDVVHSEREIHIAVNLEKLVVHGEFTIDVFTEGTEEKRPFSVTFTDVTIEAVAYLIPNIKGQMEVTKVIPSVMCGESQILAKSKPAPNGRIMQLVLTHVEKNVEKRFARIAVLEAVNAGYNEENDLPNTFQNEVVYEARRFVSQRYDPYTIRLSKEDKAMLSLGRLGPIHLHGFSNFDVTDCTPVAPTNNSVNILLQIVVRDLYGNFSLFLEEACVGAFSIGKIEFIAKITLMADYPEAVPELACLGMEITDHNCRLRKKANGVTIDDMQLGHDFENLFWGLIHLEISEERIINEIQSEILNRMHK